MHTQVRASIVKHNATGLSGRHSRAHAAKTESVEHAVTFGVGLLRKQADSKKCNVLASTRKQNIETLTSLTFTSK